MQFGETPLNQCTGAVLAHSLKSGGKVFPKGKVLSEDDIAFLFEQGESSLVVAKLDESDIDENTAAFDLATLFAGDNIRVEGSTHGRANLIASVAGLVCLNTEAINTFNRLDADLGLATLPPFAKVEEGTLIATLKIIPYAITDALMARAQKGLADDQKAIRVAPFQDWDVQLIQTYTPSLKPSLLTKGFEAVSKRLESFGIQRIHSQLCDHKEAELATVLASPLPDGRQHDLRLVLAASATSDRKDVVPAAIQMAKGKVLRVGLPVDPGNLLTFGHIAQTPVVGLPGCVRAPNLNGSDWVLARLIAGLDLTDHDMADMGVGGLLKESPQRPQPRLRPKPRSNLPALCVPLILLGAGQSTRMRGEDKLLRPLQDHGPSLLETVATRLKGFDPWVVVDETQSDKRSLLQSLGVKTVTADHTHLGMSQSLKAGLKAVDPTASAVVIALADMPDIKPSHIERLIQAHKQQPDAKVVCFVAPNGVRGHPILLSRDLFENLHDLKGDQGAKQLIADLDPSYIVTIQEPDFATLSDLDTPEDWQAWQLANPK